MNKLMLLLRLQFLNLPGLNPQLYGGTAKTRRRAVLIALGAGFVILALLGTSAMYSVMLAFSLKPLGALELLPTLMMFVASIVVLMTGVYKSVNLLFTFRDYDTLAALPVPGATLLGSRFLMLYLSNLGFMSLILVPALAVYGVMAAPGAGFWVAAVVSFFFIPLLPVLAGTLLGLMISLAASRFRHSNAMTAPSACALSLEGNSLSILKSLPVRSRAVLLSKAAVTAVLTGGATVVNALALTIALRPTLLEALWLWILPLLYGFVSAQAGLLFNLRLPNFSWTSEVTVIKQSIPVLLAMLVALALSAPPLALTLLLPPGQTALIPPLAALGLAAVNLLLYRLLVTWGVKAYERL